MADSPFRPGPALGRYEVEALIRALTGGASPEPGQTLIFGENFGWKFGFPGEEGILAPEEGGTGSDEEPDEGDVLVGDGNGGYVPTPIDELVSRNIDGGFAESVYLTSQSIDGGDVDG